MEALIETSLILKLLRILNKASEKIIISGVWLCRRSVIYKIIVDIRVFAGNVYAHSYSKTAFSPGTYRARTILADSACARMTAVSAMKAYFFIHQGIVTSASLRLIKKAAERANFLAEPRMSGAMIAASALTCAGIVLSSHSRSGWFLIGLCGLVFSLGLITFFGVNWGEALRTSGVIRIFRTCKILKANGI